MAHLVLAADGKQAKQYLESQELGRGVTTARVVDSVSDVEGARGGDILVVLSGAVARDDYDEIIGAVPGAVDITHAGL